MFAILRNKCIETHRIFSASYIATLPLHGFLFKKDFEYPAKKAFYDIFPKYNISGYLFHLSQSSESKIKALGLTNSYAVKYILKTCFKHCDHWHLYISFICIKHLKYNKHLLNST